MQFGAKWLPTKNQSQKRPHRPPPVQPRPRAGIGDRVAAAGVVAAVADVTALVPRRQLPRSPNRSVPNLSLTLILNRPKIVINPTTTWPAR
jgi:hypothetical protein